MKRLSVRVTGRWAISWQVILFANLITYPQMVLTGGTLGSRQVPVEDFPTSAAVMGVAVLANAAYGTLAMFTIFRNRTTRPVPLWLYVGFYLSAGVIPVLGMEYLDSILGKQTALPVGLRLFFACLTTLWLGVIFSLLLDGRERFIDARTQLIDEAIELQGAVFRESEAGRDLRRSVDARVDERLTHARQELDRVLVLANESEDALVGVEPVVMALEDTARDSVRPLSHQLWTEVEADYPKPRAAQVFRHLWREPRFLAGNTALITAIGLPGASVRGFGAWAPVAIVLLTATIWALLRLSNAAIDRATSVGMKRALFVATTVIALVVILMYSLIPGDVTAPTQDAGSIVIAFVAGIILVSYVGALIDVRRSVLASIESDVIRTQIEAAARRSALASITREMARSLHGSVQTRLVACAASIDQAQRTGDSGAVLQALDESASILAELGTGAESLDEESLGISVDRLVDNWRAICEVNLRMDPALVGRNDLSHVARIVEEAMANSYRHGMAGCIEVDIRMMNDGSDVEIQIRDDGVGLTGNPPGLGRRIIAEYCGDRCELSRQGDWTVLRAIAPMSLG